MAIPGLHRFVRVTNFLFNIYIPTEDTEFERPDGLL